MTLANQWRSDFSWGISTGLKMATQKSYGYVTALQTGVTAMTSFNQTDQKTVSLFVIPGVLYKPTEYWNVGFSAKVLPVDLSSSARTMTSQMSSGNPTTIEGTEKSYDANGTNPLSFP